MSDSLILPDPNDDENKELGNDTEDRGAEDDVFFDAPEVEAIGQMLADELELEEMIDAEDPNSPNPKPPGYWEKYTEEKYTRITGRYEEADPRTVEWLYKLKRDRIGKMILAIQEDESSIEDQYSNDIPIGVILPMKTEDGYAIVFWLVNNESSLVLLNDKDYLLSTALHEELHIGFNVEVAFSFATVAINGEHGGFGLFTPDITTRDPELTSNDSEELSRYLIDALLWGYTHKEAKDILLKATGDLIHKNLSQI